MRPSTTAAWLLALGASSAGGRAQVTPTFQTGVESVYVDAFVAHKEKRSPELTASDFELVDNGVRQDVSVVSLDEVPLRVVLLFDTSMSVAGEKLEHLRSAGRAFLRGLRRGDEASLLTFSHDLRLRTAPTSDPGSLATVLDGLTASGGTSLFDALFAALELAEDGPGRPVIVVFTDGDDHLSWLGEAEILGRARESSALVYSVALVEGSPLSPGLSGSLQFGAAQREKGRRNELLRELASVTGGRAWELESSGGLEEAFLRIFDELQTRYLLSYAPKGVDQPGWHELKVRIKGRKAQVRARRGYYRWPHPRATPSK